MSVVRSRPYSLIIFVSILFVTVPDQATPLLFEFSNFNQAQDNIRLEGNATIFNSFIQLTANNPLETGHATYIEPMHLYDNQSGSLADFTSNFTFSIDSKNNGNHSDGFAWFIASLRFKVPDIRQGGGLGLAGGQEILNSTIPYIAVEFDTYHNAWDDLEDDHIGININSLKSVNGTRWYSSVLDGRVMEARISYNSSSQNLCVSVTGVSENITLWQDDLCYEIDPRSYLPEWVYIGFTAATGSLYEIHTIRSWSFSSKLSSPVTPEPMTSSPSDNDRLVLVVSIAVCVCIVVTLLNVLAMIWLYRSNSRPRQRTDASRTQRRPEASQVNHNREETFGTRANGETVVNSFISRNNGSELEFRTGATRFSHDMLAHATENFSMNFRLGEGVHAAVYRGYLEVMRMYVAIKRILDQGGQEIQTYMNEAAIASMLSHRNLVRLLGWCHEKNELLLVYEYAENGTLHSHLHEEGRFVDWRVRYKVAQGLASALHYLHQELPHLVLHRNIKPKNVLLDRDFNVKLGGFAIAKLIKHDVGSEIEVPGTFGYLDPDYFMTGMPSREADVYSFGVVALEISCGRKPFEQGGSIHIAHWAWELYRTGNLIKAADPKLQGQFAEEEMRRLLLVGLWSAHPDFSARPSMREVINVLNFDAPLPTLPPEFPEPPNFPPRRDSASTEASIQDPSTSGTAKSSISPQISLSQEIASTSQDESD